MKSYLVTSNAVKLAEAQAFFPDIKGIKFDLEEIQSLDPEKVMSHKLQEVFKHHQPDGSGYIVDDISFGLNCWNGFPGTMIKWFEESLSGGEDDYVKITQTYNNNQAIITSCVGWSDGVDCKIFINHIAGTIVTSRPGVGKGFYTVFVPYGSEKTLSQMTDQERNAISARGKCFEELRLFLENK
jgi:non-canonical purine NTP pyrophosphatase (RdgB/HAM1 family)